MHKFIKKLLKGEKVEWKSLKEIAEIGTGSSNRKDENEKGEYPFYVRSKNVLKSNTFEYDEEAIIIPGEGGIGEIFHYANGKYALHQRAYRIHLTTDIVKTKFVYYLMTNFFKEYIIKKSLVGTVASIRKGMIEDFIIPIPPLSVQKEIIDILDQFCQLKTALKTALKTEKILREKQYAFYRDKLLGFGEEVSWKPLKEIFHLKNGYTPSKRIEAYWENGTIPWFRMEDIRENGRVLNHSLQKVNQLGVKGKLFEANSFIISTSATIGEHALITIPFLSNQRFTCMTLKEEYKSQFDIQFLFHYCFLLGEWCKKNVSIGSFANVNMDDFRQFKLPIPPLEEQKRIADILDKLHKLTNDLKEGLPREIELREKQYCYYRDQLLNFNEHE